MNVAADTYLISILEIVAGIQLDILNHRFQTFVYGKPKHFSFNQKDVDKPSTTKTEFILIF